ncbi:o-succinylbenzoate synthase [Fulvivirga sp. RKSG066]|uniref:o-succinylbenzoate synthase n=1 Tax=Fulvivirga aurantia TaxID=2529383 RepID=UPI0012BD2BCB|nr:o-succinylbenzoate synthase [Fulvivirga aurantia]MTI22999.1 o-succinylbenzoate synthase [Fulvivirga aurantia]
MALALTFQKYVLDFKFSAGTSRGVLKQKDTYIIKVSNGDHVFGLGEAGPLKGLSIDDRDDISEKLEAVAIEISKHSLPASVEEVYTMSDQLAGREFPSIRFALETALLDLLNGGSRTIFDNDFSKGKGKIPINGLVWMGHMEDMLSQITQKVEQGFTCIKMKVGSLDFDKECDILEYVRKKYYKSELILRVDANGAFSPEEAMEKLERLSTYNLHSIEQPIKTKQYDSMAQLSKTSPVSIALDEELIGIYELEEKRRLLERIKPPYIILKPTLLGGFKSTLEWIRLANDMHIGWWLTSALESNIMLNAISQFTADLEVVNHQGLGTGQLYHNNITSPLEIKNGYITSTGQNWDLSMLDL